MKRMILAIGYSALVIAASAGLTLHAAAPAETWSNVPVIDTMCSTKAKANPDAHTAACALQCAKGGYGIVAADGTYLKLDAAGNDKVVAALKGTKKSDHLRVTVTGERKGDSITVATLQLQ